MYKIIAEVGELKDNLDFFNLDVLVSDVESNDKERRLFNKECKKQVSELSNSYLTELNNYLKTIGLKEEFIMGGQDLVEHQNFTKLKIGNGGSYVTIQFSMEWNTESKRFIPTIIGSLNICSKWSSKTNFEKLTFDNVSDIIEKIKGALLYLKIEELDTTAKIKRELHLKNEY